MIGYLLAVTMLQPFAASNGKAALQSADTVPLGTYAISGEPVTATVPANEGPFQTDAGTTAFGGARYLFREGKLIRRLGAQGAWSEVRSAYEKAKGAITPQTPEWRVKVFLYSQVSVTDRGADGLLAIRRNAFDERQIEHVRESLARFASMAEAAAGGGVRVTLSMETDPDLALWEVFPPNSDRTGLSAVWERLQTSVGRRINGGSFEADDGVYRGPWDSVFLIHAGMIGAMPSFRVFDAPVTPISYEIEGSGVGPYGLTQALFNGWSSHVRAAVAHQGFRANNVADDGSSLVGTSSSYAAAEELVEGYVPLAGPAPYVPGGKWQRTRNRLDPTTAEYMAHQSVLDVGDGMDWSAVGPAQRWNLPYVPLANLLQGSGFERVDVAARSVQFLTNGEPPKPNGNALDASLFWGMEAMCSLPFEGGSVLLVDPEYADFVGSRLKADLTPKVLGWTLFRDGRAAFVFKLKSIAAGAREADLIEGAPADRPAPEEPESPPAFGGYRVTPGSSSPLPSFNVAMPRLQRRGGVWLLGGPGFPARQIPPGSFVSFWIQSSNPEPMAVVLHGPSGERLGAVRLFGRLRAPAEAGEAMASEPVLTLEPAPDWVQVTIPLATFLNSAGGAAKALAISGITLESDPYASHWDKTIPQFESKVSVSRAKIESAAPSPAVGIRELPATTPSATGENPMARALFAAKAGGSAEDVAALVKLLADPKEVVQLNAAAAFRRIQSSDAEQPLMEAFLGLVPAISKEASAALMHQGTAVSLQILRRAPLGGPFDHCREFAADLLGPQKDVSNLQGFTQMAFRPSWQARRAGAMAMAQLPGDAPARSLMLFFKNIDPEVRYAAASGANAKLDEVARDLLFGVVNDEIDEVRYLCAVRLLEATNTAFRDEALKAVRDESKWVRLGLLDHFRKHPNETFRQSLRLAVTDSSPEVRTAALAAFAVLPGKVEKAEVANCATDPDPRVAAAYRALAAAKGFE